MSNDDFAVFYDNQPDYIAFRNDEERQNEYRIIVDWKVRKLLGVIPECLRFKNVLEVGCALGILLNKISDRLHIETRSGVDISAENIKTATSLFPQCEFFKGTLEDYVREKSFLLKNHKHDLVVLSDIIEHIPDDLEFLKLVRQVSEYVVVNLPLEKSFINRKRKYGANDPSGHLRSYDKKMAKKLFTNAGFIVLRDNDSIATSDAQFSAVYKKNRRLRIRSKPFLRRIFWSWFYAVEDKFKLVNESVSTRIYGANYFVFLSSS